MPGSSNSMDWRFRPMFGRVVDFFRCERLRDIGPIGLEQRGGGGDFDFRTDVADPQRDVITCHLVDAHCDGVGYDLLKSGGFNGDFVSVGNQLTFLVVAGYVRGEHELRAFVHVL